LSNSLAISLQNIHPGKPSQRKIGGGIFPIPASLVAAPRIFIFCFFLPTRYKVHCQSLLKGFI